MKIGVRIKKLNKNAIIPKYYNDWASGADIFACMGGDTVVPAGETVMIHTGIAMEVPIGCAGLVYARSGIASSRGLAPANKVGVIDSDYRGEIIIAMHNHSKQDAVIADGERIAQFIVSPMVIADFELVDELEPSARGEGGFGSTGI